MPLNLLYLPSEVIALIGWCLDSRRDIRALIETHPRFACQMQLWESYHCIEGNSFMHESGLLFACKTGNEIIARELMKDGACAWANSRFSRSWTDIVSYPLPIAARNGFCSIVKVLLKHSDPIIPHSEKFDFIMLQAIKAGSKETVEVLLSIKDDKIDPDFQLRRRKRHRYLGSVKPGCGPDTPLKTAMALANEEITRLLLDDGQFVFNMSSLGIAAAAGLDDLVKMILENPYPTRTAIADAARGGHMSTLKILVQDGRLDPNQPDKMGWAALHYAVYYGMMDMLQFLLGVECIRPDFRSDDRLGGNHTPFSEAAQHGDIKMMKILMRTRKVSAHYITWSSWTPLHHAAYAGSAKAVCFLLAQGVQIDQHDENFPSPFALAAAGGYLDVMRILHSTGKVDIESLGQEDRTPLSYAAGGGNPEAVAFLLAKGVNPDPKDSKGRTPLLYAAQQCNSSVVKVLLAIGKVDFNCKDLQHERTPLHWAMQTLPLSFLSPQFFKWGEKGECLYSVLRDLGDVLLWQGSRLAPLDNDTPWRTRDGEWGEKPHLLWDPLGVFRQLLLICKLVPRTENSAGQFGSGFKKTMEIGRVKFEGVGDA